jgi:hypothetical protein
MEATTIFRNYENTEFYLYDHLSGVMTMLIDDGCMKGLYTRCDSKSAHLARKFHKEQIEGVPYEHRLFEPLNREQFNARFCKVVDALNRNLVQTLDCTDDTTEL